jgi:argininosuccinate lyase
MGKLWQKGYTLDALMEEFTVGNDYLIDLDLIGADCLASIAHGRTLQKAAILSKEELDVLEEGLREILTMNDAKEFSISLSDEDCHTAIEAYLTKKVGDVGKKIHTGRSRNDQVQTALRLWMREFVLQFSFETAQLASAILGFAKEHEFIPMPGRTHMQLAMPSSIGLWASAFAEELLDEVRVLMNVLDVLDQSPLGSAASYGTPLALDRSFSTSQMGFARVQNNVLYANNSRGKFEAILLDACDYIGLSLSKMAQDLILFSLPEIGYFSLPKELCTGSSIMPQKRNPDGLELTRSRSAVISSCSQRVKAIIRSLPSGYNRDFQDTKEPLFTGCKTALLSVRVMHLMVQSLQVNPEALRLGCVSELYATDEVLKRLSAGGSFRDVYKEVGMDLDSVASYDPDETIRNRTSEGTTGNLGLDSTIQRAQELELACESKISVLMKVYANLAGREIRLVRW